jgi:cytochrome b561
LALLKNTPLTFGWISIGLHWLSFVAVVFLFCVGVYMVDLTYYDPLYHELPEWHKAVGVMLAGLTLLRLSWIVYSPAPAVLAASPWQQKLARAAHGVLYLMLLLLLISGYLITTADGKPLQVFNVILLNQTVALNPALAEWVGLIHQWVSYGLVVVVLGHGAAALKHHFINKDQTLLRMLWVRRDHL